MPHICHIATTFNLRSGSARRTSAILRGCLEQGYKVSLILGRDRDVTECDLPDVDIYIVPELVKYISPWRDAIAPWKLRRLLNRIKPDLVHTHLAKAGIVGRLAALSAQVPCILHTVHGPTFPLYFNPVKRVLFRMLEKLCGRFTDWFVFVGNELQQEYLNAGICQPDTSKVIQTGRPDIVFDRQEMSVAQKKALRTELCGGSMPEFLLVTVGRLVPSKQLEHAVRVVRALHLKSVPVHLVFVGKCLLKEEQQYEERLIKLAIELGIEEYVHFPGFRDDVIDIMASADAVLLTSLYEGLPNVAVEAVISGTPMITYDVSGVREILKEGKSGWIVPQGDEGQVVDRVMQLMHRKTDKRDVCDTRDNNVLQDFRESVMVKRKIQLYEQVLFNSSRND